ncbi:sensor domain-containing protein [Motilibacter aurantiacus]|uniref:sensor domain-containing protein n=1 Tax=Motilibacter aurantiacus TaxID=2714955 RepID=UPI00140C8FC8|nr:EAL domain-containing protein [Motilibacter aurantiacus]
MSIAQWGTVAPPIDYAGIFHVTTTPSLVLDRDFTILDANPAYLRMTNRRSEELVGRYFFDAFPSNPAARDEEGARNLRRSLEQARDTGRPHTLELQKFDIPSTVPGRFVERFWSPTNLPVLDARGETTLILHRVLDVTDFVLNQRGDSEGTGLSGPSGSPADATSDLVARAWELQQLNAALRDARDQLSARAHFDPLTGLLVRSVFLESVGDALGRIPSRSDHPVAVLFVDLDRLKSVNDTYGHGAGDQLIRCAAERLKASVRPNDAVGRLGGDEFVVLLGELKNKDEATVVAERILENLAAPAQLAPGLTVQPSASIGVAVTDDPEMSADTLLSHADTAMYRAKQSGRNRWELFDEAAYTAITARQQLEAELSVALAADQLELHYQPIIDLRTDAVHAVEALLRWQHPTRGLLPAGEFIDVAEDSRVLLEIGRRVISLACLQLAAWDQELGELAPKRMFLNVSVAELAHPGLDEHVRAALAAAGIAPERLVLEITETGVLEDTHVVGSAVEGLLSLGCELAIDDFGTGYSSLSRLVQLPARILKIDRSFVRGLAADHESVAVVSAVLLLAHNLRKSVVAEGVEDPQALDALRELGCAYAQGFHLALPKPAAELTPIFAAVVPHAAPEEEYVV